LGWRGPKTAKEEPLRLIVDRGERNLNRRIDFYVFFSNHVLPPTSSIDRGLREERRARKILGIPYSAIPVYNRMEDHGTRNVCHLCLVRKFGHHSIDE